MQYTLRKHDGLGNDFLVFDTAQGTPTRPWDVLAREWCDRTNGPGADGLLLLGGVGTTDLTMRLHNADGSIAEMSGNGIRCLVMAAHRATTNGVGTTYRVSTDAGPREATIIADDPDGTLHISVDMGFVTDLPVPDRWESLGCNPDRPVRHVSVGNPHSVVWVGDVSEVDLKALGELVPHVNLEIIEPGPETNGVTMRVHERGAGITMACGTGACAVADAACAWGIVPNGSDEVIVHMDGGDARVRVSPDRRATLIGPTNHRSDHAVTV
jgi:diaminopimelate epimerase